MTSLVQPPGPTLRLVAAISAAVMVGLAFAIPELRAFYAGLATFEALCCLTPGGPQTLSVEVTIEPDGAS